MQNPIPSSSVSFVKFLRTPLLSEHLWWPLLNLRNITHVAGNSIDHCSDMLLVGEIRDQPIFCMHLEDQGMKFDFYSKGKFSSWENIC